jgi:hypothetical protein
MYTVILPKITLNDSRKTVSQNIYNFSSLLKYYVFQVSYILYIVSA